MSRDFCSIDYSIVDESLKRFSETIKNPHPRFNDGAKPEGALIIEPGAGGFIIELGVQEIAKNCKIVM